MKQQIIKILRYTPYQYDMMVFELYYAWCIEHSFNHNHLQKLISNRKLHSWFMREYTNKERNFLEYSKDYQGSSVKMLRNLYDTETCSINFFPKAILNEIRKTVKKTTVIGAHPAVRPNLN